MDKKIALPLYFLEEFAVRPESRQDQGVSFNSVYQEPVRGQMKFMVRHPMSYQRMVFPFGIKALILYLIENCIKDLHIFPGFPCSFQVLLKSRGYFDAHSSAISLSTSLRSSAKEEYVFNSSGFSFIASIVSLLGTYVLKGMSRSLTSLVKVIRTKSDMERPIAERISLASDFNSLSSRTRIKASAVLIKAPFKECLHCSTNIKKLVFGFLALLPLFCQADDFGELAKRCAPSVAEDTLRAIVKTESGFNPYAIGVVKGGRKRKIKQPRAYHEAMSTIAELELSGADYSVGLAQINRKNFSKYGISASQALDACTNLKVASRILSACFTSAKQSPASDGKALHDALSCYYSGNFKTGYRHGYVDKVRSNAGLSPLSVPSIREVETSKPQQSLIAEGVPGYSSGLIF